MRSNGARYFGQPQPANRTRRGHRAAARAHPFRIGVIQAWPRSRPSPPRSRWLWTCPPTDLSQLHRRRDDGCSGGDEDSACRLPFQPRTRWDDLICFTSRRSQCSRPEATATYTRVKADARLLVPYCLASGGLGSGAGSAGSAVGAASRSSGAAAQSPAQIFVPLTIPTSLQPIGASGLVCLSGLPPTLGAAV